jgi:hypothetical protein
LARFLVCRHAEKEYPAVPMTNPISQSTNKSGHGECRDSVSRANNQNTVASAINAAPCATNHPNPVRFHQ